VDASDCEKEEPPVGIGELVGGKYRVGEALASGGMGTVVACVDEMLGRPVVLKFLKPKLAADPDVVERFMREARAAARIRNDHVVQVYEVGSTSGGIPYMVMERLEGQDLEELRLSRGPLPVSEAVDLCLQALDAISDAHEQGIVHRDLKPSNLFLAQRRGKAPIVKVLDFGISKVAAEHQAAANITRTGSMLGSPGYMSPEQVRSIKNVDRRTDLWSLGVILYEMLTGENAFDGQTLGEVFSKIREEDLPAPSTRRADIPADLDHVMQRCLARNRDARYATAAELRAALLPFASEHTRAAFPATFFASAPDRQVSLMASARTPTPRVLGEGAWSATHHLRSRGRAWYAVALVPVVLAGAWFGWRALQPAPENVAPASDVSSMREAPEPAEPKQPPEEPASEPSTTASSAPAPSASASAPAIVPRLPPRPPASSKPPRRPGLGI
jgi:serine/threonine-protein kinase